MLKNKPNLPQSFRNLNRKCRTGGGENLTKIPIIHCSWDDQPLTLSALQRINRALSSRSRITQPWPVYLSGWSIGLHTTELRVQFLVKGVYLGCGLLPALSNQSRCLFYIDVFLFLPLPHFHFLWKAMEKKYPQERTNKNKKEIASYRSLTFALYIISGYNNKLIWKEARKCDQ